jgi:hypothetical protein
LMRENAGRHVFFGQKLAQCGRNNRCKSAL